MIMLVGRPDPVITEAAQFARSILDATATAYYEVDGDLNLGRFLLDGIPRAFHEAYVARMNRFDPLHPRQLSDRPVARLSIEARQSDTQEAADYCAFAAQSGIADMIEFFFRRNGRIVAGMSVAWSMQDRIGADAMTIAAKIHDYLEFNLVRSVPSGDGSAQYGLTAREREVVELVCCGRTNREISECLNIGLATVKTHLIHIFEKLGVETRSAVVALMSRRH